MKDCVLYIAVIKKECVTAEFMLKWVHELADIIMPDSMMVKTLGNGKFRKYNLKKLEEEIKNERLKEKIMFRISTEKESFTVREARETEKVIFSLFILKENQGKAIEELIQETMCAGAGIVAAKCSSLDDFWQNTENINYYQWDGKALKDVKLKRRENGLKEEIVDIEYNPGHSHIENGLWFGSCFCMWFGRDYYQYIPKEKLQSYSNCYENVELENEVICIKLYEDMWDYENPINRNKQLDFRNSVGMDEIAHSLHNQKKKRVSDPEIEIIPEGMSEDGKRKIKYYLDEKGKNVPKSKAASVKTFIYASDGRLERVENEKI